MRRIAFLQSCLSVAIALITAATIAPSFAQTYPSRTITVIFPYPAGSPVDSAFRPVGEKASALLGQTVVTESRPGANSRLGMSAIKSVPPDGYLLTMASDAILVSQPLIDPTFQVEPGRDYLPVAFILEFPTVLLGSAPAPVNNIKDIISYAKANPGKLNFAIVPGGTSQFLLERFKKVAGIDVTVVPYKGSPQALLDLVAGRVDLLLSASYAAATPHIASGKLKGLATTGYQRWSAYPNLPTLTEEGVSVANTSWYGILAPRGTPNEVLQKLNSTFNTVLKSPEIRKVLEDNFGMSTGRNSSIQEFTAFIRSETKVWEPILRNSGIKME